MSQPIKDNWIGASPIFLLEIRWNGEEHNLSTIPITVNSSFGDMIFKGGLLEDPNIIDDLGELGFDVSSRSTSISALISPRNVLKEIFRANTLQGAEGELSALLIKEGNIQNYEERIQLIKGQIKQPVFGHVDRPEGYVEFSIEAPAFDGSLYAFETGNTSRLTANDISSLTNIPQSPFTLTGDKVDLYKPHIGKRLPIYFGESGKFFDSTGTQIFHSISPAYVIGIASSHPYQMWIALAGHYVDSTQVRIFDGEGASYVADVSHWIRSDNQVFAFCSFDLFSGGFRRLQSPIDDNQVNYYASWSFGGGLLSRTKKTTITGGGDLCLYLLQLGGADIDFAAWYAVAPVLNVYKFAGFIGEDTLSPLEFIEQEIIPLLPVRVIHGNEGLKPVLDLFSSESNLYVKHEISASSDFQQNSSIETLTDMSDIVNHVTFEYTHDPKQNAFLQTMRITPDPLTKHNYEFTNLDSQLSAQKYGVMKETLESKYVYDNSTAARICCDRVRFKGIAVRTVEYLASARYGYVEIGDIIALNDTNLFQQVRNVQVIRREFTNQNWRFTLKIDDSMSKDLI